MVEALGAAEDFLLVTGKGAMDEAASFFEEALRNRNSAHQMKNNEDVTLTPSTKIWGRAIIVFHMDNSELVTTYFSDGADENGCD